MHDNNSIANNANGARDIVNGVSGNPVDATENWWGSDKDPSHRVSGNVIVGPWLVLTVTPDRTTVPVGGRVIITVDLLHDSDGVYHDPRYGHVPDGLVVIYTAINWSSHPHIGLYGKWCGNIHLHRNKYGYRYFFSCN